MTATQAERDDALAALAESIGDLHGALEEAIAMGHVHRAQNLRDDIAWCGAAIARLRHGEEAPARALLAGEPA